MTVDNIAAFRSARFLCQIRHPGLPLPNKTPPSSAKLDAPSSSQLRKQGSKTKITRKKKRKRKDKYQVKNKQDTHVQIQTKYKQRNQTQ